MPSFARYIGIDYSGARTPRDALAGLRIYCCAANEGLPCEVAPPAGARKYWSRRGAADWLIERLGEKQASLVGIDHGFSFPLKYFETYGIERRWTAFLDDFQRHWPSDDSDTSVESIRRGLRGSGRARLGDSRWRRLCEVRSRGAKSVFHFDVQGSVAKSTHAGLPWLLSIRRRAARRVHFWPFDGWRPPADRSVVAEIYPSLWRKQFASDGRTGDQHDAFAVAAWMAQADREGVLERYFNPPLTPRERALARFEGWILGVL